MPYNHINTQASEMRKLPSARKAAPPAPAATEGTLCRNPGRARGVSNDLLWQGRHCHITTSQKKGEKADLGSVNIAAAHCEVGSTW